MFEKVRRQYKKDAAEHEMMIKGDPYYAYCYGGGIVPSPCCRYCAEYDGDRCHKEWNNNDESYYIPERDDQDPSNCCEQYEWSGEWEDE